MTSKETEKVKRTPVDTLLVDDNIAILQALKRVFEKNGFAVKTADSRRSAMAAIAKHTFELVVTDVRMETSDAGFDVAKLAKTHLGPPTVVVVLSAFPIPAPVWRRTGADVFILKGAGVADRLEGLRALVERRRLAQ